jgi:transposase-like protein
MMTAEHRRLPFSISVDKDAAYPEAFNASQEERVLLNDCQLRRVKYLNNVTGKTIGSSKGRCEPHSATSGFT